MRNVLVLPVRRLAAGHGDRIPVVPLENFDVVHHKTVVNGHGHHGLELARKVADFPNTYIIDLHMNFPL